MNFKHILLTIALLANLAYNRTEAITQITSDSEFQGVIAQGRSAIAVGLASDYTRFNALINQLASIKNQFPSVNFYWALANNIPYSAIRYNLGFGVALFQNDNILDRIGAPLSTNSLISQMKRFFGGKPLAGN